MFNSANIKYHIDNSTKTVTAYATGFKYDALEALAKAGLKVNLLVNDLDVVEIKEVSCDAVLFGYDHMTTCKKYLLPDTLEASAKYNPEDPHPYSVERGMNIARRRLYNKYNKAYHDATFEIVTALSDMWQTLVHNLNTTHDRIVNFEYFNQYAIKGKTDPFDKPNHCSCGGCNGDCGCKGD